MGSDTSTQATPFPQMSSEMSSQQSKDIQELKDKLNSLGDLGTRVSALEKKTLPPMQGIITKDNFNETFKSAATDTSVSQAWSTGSKVSSAVTEWMNVPDNQTKIKNMVQDGTGYAMKADLTALQQKVDGLDAGGSGDSAASSSGSSGLTFSALKTVGCTRWNWFHDSNRKICYAKNCDPQTTYKDGRCFSDRSNCTDAKTDIVVLADGTCQAALGKICKAPEGAACKAECPAGDDQIQMPTECSGPLILRDLYGDSPSSTPTPLVQEGAFPELHVGKLKADTVEVTDELQGGDATKTLKVRGNIHVQGGDLEVETTETTDAKTKKVTAHGGNIRGVYGGARPYTLANTGTVSVGQPDKSWGNLVVNGNISAKCPACCLAHIATDCPLAYPYAFAAGGKQGSACCSKPAGGGAPGKQPTTCSGEFIACPKSGGNCAALQIGDTNPCPDCSTCGKIDAEGAVDAKTNLNVKNMIKSENTIKSMNTIVSRNDVIANRALVATGGFDQDSVQGVVDNIKTRGQGLYPLGLLPALPGKYTIQMGESYKLYHDDSERTATTEGQGQVLLRDPVLPPTFKNFSSLLAGAYK